MTKLSICIPTYRRFDPFLKRNLPLYLQNPYVDEIVICDEDGEDIDRIREVMEHIPNVQGKKIVLLKNDKRLYAFHNKEKVVQHATNEWVCLMDSDNFAPITYFDAWKRYTDKHTLQNDVVYMPIKTCARMDSCTQDQLETGFDFSEFMNEKEEAYESSNISKYDISKMGCLFNTGNYIFNRSTYLNTSEIAKEYIHIAENVHAVDVVFKNALMMKKGAKFVLVPGMVYEHVVHHGSYFLNTEGVSRSYLPKIYDMFRTMSSQL